MIGRLFRWVFKFFLWLLIVSIAWVFVYKHIKVPATPTMIVNSIQNLRAGDGPVIWQRQWVDIDSVPAHVLLAIIAAEDQKFPTHKGFDFDAIEKALEKNKEGKSIKGGSTISQQTAKNVFLWQGRTWLRKGLEAYFTVLIENIWGKKRILEVYINIAEMGEGIYGVGAAAEAHFDKPVDKLSPREAALLAAVLPSPKTYIVRQPSPYLHKRQGWILQQMRNLQGIEMY